jgi:poly(3-hydroxybutyrate) depolymerase
MTRFSFLVSILCFIFLSSCGNAAGKQQLIKQIEDNASPLVNVDGRAYRLYVPKNLRSGKVPLLLALHGGYGNSEYFEHFLGMNKVADRKGFIVAYPNGTEGKIWLMKNKRMWNAGNCCGIASRKNIDDVEFLADVIRDVTAKYPIDPKKVYITGHSNGAMMSYKFVCERPEMVAAMVSVSGQLTADRCKSAVGVKVLHIHGNNDEHVPYQGGSTIKSAKGLNYRSVLQTESALKQSGADFTLKTLPKIDHNLTNINGALKNGYGENLAETIAGFLKGKEKE